jgi:hypothetical protein
VKARDTGSDRPLLDKLGVKPGMRVALLELDDPEFVTALRGCGAQVVEPSPGLDLVFYLVNDPAELGRIAELRPLIRDAGAIWILRLKGTGRRVREEDVIAAGRLFDLVDNKIASFSHTLAAMRLVVPLNHRQGG